MDMVCDFSVIFFKKPLDKYYISDSNFGNYVYIENRYFKRAWHERD